MNSVRGNRTMRNKALILPAIIGMLLILTGCLSGCKNSLSQGDFRTNSTEQTEAVDETVLANAGSVYDLAPLMTMNEDKLLYSECRHDKDLHFYFDVLNFDEYIKVNYKGKDYALLYYDFSSYGLVVKDIKSVKKTYSGQSLNVEVNVKTKEKPIDGCFPNTTKCRLILKLDQNVSSINVMDRPFNEYSGGRVFICGKEGIVDKDLQFLVPPVYDGIFDLTTFEESNCPMYYRVFKDGNNGVLDNNYEPVLSINYGNIYYINEDKFIVGKYYSDSTQDEIYILDSNENIIKKAKGFLSSVDDSRFYCAEGQIKFADPSCGDMWGFGVMDQELNTIIEPAYFSIYWLGTRYKIEDLEFNELYFDVSGNQL